MSLVTQYHNHTAEDDMAALAFDLLIKDRAETPATPYETKREARDDARRVFRGTYDLDDIECVDCGSDVHEIHHADGDPFNNDIRNLMGLCETCHAQKH